MMYVSVPILLVAVVKVMHTFKLALQLWVGEHFEQESMVSGCGCSHHGKLWPQQDLLDPEGLHLDPQIVL